MIARAKIAWGVVKRAARFLAARYAPAGYAVAFEYSEGGQRQADMIAVEDVPAFIRETRKWMAERRDLYGGFVIMDVRALGKAEFEETRRALETDFTPPKQSFRVKNHNGSKKGTIVIDNERGSWEVIWNDGATRVGFGNIHFAGIWRDTDSPA